MQYRYVHIHFRDRQCHHDSHTVRVLDPRASVLGFEIDSFEIYAVRASQIITPLFLFGSKNLHVCRLVEASNTSFVTLSHFEPHHDNTIRVGT